MKRKTEVLFSLWKNRKEKTENTFEIFILILLFSCVCVSVLTYKRQFSIFFQKKNKAFSKMQKKSYFKTIWLINQHLYNKFCVLKNKPTINNED